MSRKSICSQIYLPSKYFENIWKNLHSYFDQESIIVNPLLEYHKIKADKDKEKDDNYIKINQAHLLNNVYIYERSSQYMGQEKLRIVIKILETEDTPYIKSALFELIISDKIVYNTKLTLFLITSDNKSLLKLEFFNFQNSDDLYLDSLNLISTNLLNYFSNYVENGNNKTTFQYEGIDIDVNYDALMDNLDINELMNIFNNQLCKSTSEGYLIKEFKDNNLKLEKIKSSNDCINLSKHFKDGVIIKGIIFKEVECYFYLKEVLRKNKKDLNKIMIIITPLSELISSFSSELHITIIQINQNKLFLSLCTIFYFPQNQETCSRLGARKKIYLNNIKKYYEDKFKTNSC